MHRYLLGGMCCLGLLLLPSLAQARQKAPPPPELRLSRVGPEARTRVRRAPFGEALPGQALAPKTTFESGAEDAEIEIGAAGRLRLGPGTVLTIERRPQKRSSGSLQLVRGTLTVDLPPEAPPLLVRTATMRISVRGAAYLEAAERSSSLAMHSGTAKVRARGPEVTLSAGEGVRVGLKERPNARIVPTTPTWDAARPPLLLARGALGDPGAMAEAVLPFAAQKDATAYLLEVSRSEKFYQILTRASIPAPPFRTRLLPGLYYARVTALGADRLQSAPSQTTVVRVISLRTDAEAKVNTDSGGGELRLSRKLATSLVLSGEGQPLRVRIDEGAELDCRSWRTFRLGPGEHRVRLSLLELRSELLVAVAPPPKVPPPPKKPEVVGAAPLGLPVPLTTPGFPLRALSPRTRAYALLGVGASGPGHTANVYRLDLGGELAFFRKSFSVDANLPILYHRPLPTDQTGQFALGDLQLGFRAVALRFLDGRLSLGPLLRLQLPTGTFTRPDYPDGHPVVLDPALALSIVLGPLGLLTTQGPTAVLAVPASAIRWSMSYAAELRLGWLGVVAELDAALGIGAATSGAALGGGLRARLPGTRPGRGSFALLFGARGGLGERSQELFGRYQATAGVEWLR